MHARLRQTSETVDAAAIDLRHRQTPAEESIWSRLRNRQLDGLKFRRQHPIAHYVLDFYCAEARLGIELDGDVHLEQQAMDQFRTEFLASLDIEVIRYSNDRVLAEIDNVLKNIADACAQRIAGRTRSSSPAPGAGAGAGGEGR